MTNNREQNLNELQVDIMGCQGFLDDLRMLSWRLDDQRDQIDPVDIANIIQGLESLYDIKFRKLWETYSLLIK